MFEVSDAPLSFPAHQVSLATVIFVASQKALSAEVKATIRQQLESVSNGWTVYRIARQASRMVCVAGVDALWGPRSGASAGLKGHAGRDVALRAVQGRAAPLAMSLLE